MERRRKSLRAKYIEQLPEIIDALDLCEQYDVCYDGLDSLDEIKDRLRLHYNLTKYGNVKKKVGIWSCSFMSLLFESVSCFNKQNYSFN